MCAHLKKKPTLNVVFLEAILNKQTDLLEFQLYFFDDNVNYFTTFLFNMLKYEYMKYFFIY